MSSPPPSRGSFLSLPIEIRLMIYEYALANSRIAIGWSGSWDFGRRELEKTPFSLLRSCKRVYADIVDTWPQWCVLDLGPLPALRQYSSARPLDVLSRMPEPAMRNIQTLCIPAFTVMVFRPSPEQDLRYNGSSFLSMFKHLNLKRLLLRWDDTISSPSSPAGHDYQYAVLREQLVQYGTGWQELYLATPFQVLSETLDREIKRRDGIESGACASLHVVNRDERGPLEIDPEFRCIYDALANSSPKGCAHVIVVKRGRDVNVQDPPATTPVINDIHMQIRWFRSSESWADSSSYTALRRSFIA